MLLDRSARVQDASTVAGALLLGVMAAVPAHAQPRFSLDIGSDNSSDPNGAHCFDCGEVDMGGRSLQQNVG